MTPDQLEQVKNYLIDHRDQFRTFWKGDADIKSQFKSGEVVISSGYPDDAKALRKEGVNVQFAVAKEGQMLWTCGYGISPDAQNLDAAYALLNWYSSLPPQIYAATNFNYITSNMGVGDEVPEKVIEDSGLDTFGEATQRDPRESAERPRGVGRSVDRGESLLVAQVAQPVGLDATRSIAPGSDPHPSRRQPLGVARVPRDRVPRAVRAARRSWSRSRSTTRASWPSRSPA